MIASPLSLQILPISLSIATFSLSVAPFRFLSRFSALTASWASNPSMMLASNKFAAIYSRFALLLNGSSGAFFNRFGAGVSAGCSSAAADGVVVSSFDFDRAGLVGAVGGVAEELRPLAVLLGAGATITASGSAAALDELDAAPGVREVVLPLALAFAAGGAAEASLLAARGFAALASAASAAASRFGTEAARGVRELLLPLALAFAAGGGVEASLFAALASAAAAAASRFGTEAARFGTEASRFVALGTEAARGGVSFSGIGSGSIFDHAITFASSAVCFPLRRVASLINFGSGFLNLLDLILPLPGGGGGPPPGGGAIPAGVSGGPGCMCSINSLAFCTRFTALPITFVPYGDFRTASIFTAFPFVAFSPLTLAIIGDAPGPGGPGGCCQPGAYTGSAGVLFGCGIAWFARLSTYDWSIDAAPDGPM